MERSGTSAAGEMAWRPASPLSGAVSAEPWPLERARHGLLRQKGNHQEPHSTCQVSWDPGRARDSLCYLWKPSGLSLLPQRLCSTSQHFSLLLTTTALHPPGENPWGTGSAVDRGRLARPQSLWECISGPSKAGLLGEVI